MPIGEVCVREVVVASSGTTVQEAARIMRHNHVGNLVVVDAASGRRIPIGIVTDRDIVISVVATKLDPTVFTLADLVTQPLVTVTQDQGVFECIQHMRTHGVRRMPVVDRQGDLVGIISVDDLIQLLGEEMAELGKLISREQEYETKRKR